MWALIANAGQNLNMLKQGGRLLAWIGNQVRQLRLKL